MQCTDSIGCLLGGDCGIASPIIIIHRLIAIFHESVITSRSFVSHVVARKLVMEREMKSVTLLQTFVKYLDNPVVQGWSFEIQFLAFLRTMSRGNIGTNTIELKGAGTPRPRMVARDD